MDLLKTMLYLAWSVQWKVLIEKCNFIATSASCVFIIVFCFSDNTEILNLAYETNPLDESCDQRIRLTAEPLLITYDVKTLAKISAMFE